MTVEWCLKIGSCICSISGNSAEGLLPGILMAVLLVGGNLAFSVSAEAPKILVKQSRQKLIMKKMQIR